MRNEIKVGLFVLISLISILFLTFEVKSLENFKEKGYVLYAIVNDASGLAEKSRVKLRGVKIGVIKSMQLTNNCVKLKLLINKNVKIPKGSMVTVAQDNVLGGKYLEIIPPKKITSYYSPNETITKHLSSASMADVLTNVNIAVNKIKILIDKLNNTLDKNTTKNIKYTIANIKDSSIYLKNILKNINGKIPALLNNANKLILTYKASGEIINHKLPGILNKTDTLMAKLNNVADVLKQKLPKLADEYIKVGKNANDILVKNKNSLAKTIAAAKNFFANGSNSFQKIDKFLAKVQNLRINVDITSDLLLKDNYFKTTANLALTPAPTRYYIIGLTSTENYENPQSVSNKDSKVYINAEIGKRYQNLLLRGGIIESTGGVGIDYFMYNDKVKLSADLYDFNSQNDYRDTSPHLDLSARYLYLKHLEFIAGVDDLINTDARQFFLGIGVNFNDNDLKTFVSGGASSFLK